MVEKCPFLILLTSSECSRKIFFSRLFVRSFLLLYISFVHLFCNVGGSETWTAQCMELPLIHQWSLPHPKVSVKFLSVESLFHLIRKRFYFLGRVFYPVFWHMVSYVVFNADCCRHIFMFDVIHKHKVGIYSCLAWQDEGNFCKANHYHHNPFIFFIFNEN